MSCRPEYSHVEIGVADYNQSHSGIELDDMFSFDIENIGDTPVRVGTKLLEPEDTYSKCAIGTLAYKGQLPLSFPTGQGNIRVEYTKGVKCSDKKADEIIEKTSFLSL